MTGLWDMLTNLGFWGWIFLIPIVAIIVEGVVVSLKMWIKHAERMAMIEQGMDPGAVDRTYEKDKV